MKILLIEDDPIFAGVLSQLIEMLGHTTDSITDFNNFNHNNAVDADIIMIDFRCIDTYSFLDNREDNSDVIIMGGDIDDNKKINLREKGVLQILDKPFRLDELNKILTAIDLVSI